MAPESPDDAATANEAAKGALIEALARLQEAVLWKLDGISDYDLRRPLTATGSNLLGIVKHLAAVQAGYFGECFGRPFPHPMPWFEPQAPVNADMWVTPQESTASIIELYRASWAHAVETFAVIPGDRTGLVPWWPADRNRPSLITLLVHVSVETARHAGHLDIVRELIDERAGRFADDRSMPHDDEIDWAAYRAQVQEAADAVR